MLARFDYEYYPFMTKGKFYKILRKAKHIYYVKNDMNYEVFWNRDKFTTVLKENKITKVLYGKI